MSGMDESTAPWLRRFLHPGHAVIEQQPGQLVGRAGTPAADAVCEIHLSLEDGRIMDAGFAVYGPPVAIACADWLCEQLPGRTIAAARGRSTQDMQAALALAPQERYGAMLAVDALNTALNHLQS